MDGTDYFNSFFNIYIGFQGRQKKGIGGVISITAFSFQCWGVHTAQEQRCKA